MGMFQRNIDDLVGQRKAVSLDSAGECICGSKTLSSSFVCGARWEEPSGTVGYEGDRAPGFLSHSLVRLGSRQASAYYQRRRGGGHRLPVPMEVADLGLGETAR